MTTILEHAAAKSTKLAEIAVYREDVARYTTLLLRDETLPLLLKEARQILELELKLIKILEPYRGVGCVSVDVDGGRIDCPVPSYALFPSVVTAEYLFRWQESQS